jgi:hypothetical protein
MTSNSLIKIFFLCPVPDDQKPIAEYIELKKNSLLNWTSFSNKKYNLKLFSVFFTFFCLISFFEICSFPFSFFKEIIETVKELTTNWQPEYGEKIEKIVTLGILTVFFTLLFMSFFLLQTIFTLKEINSHFRNPRLCYEEGSWYQTKIWEKPFLLMKNEKLIRNQKIEPIIQRIKNSFFLIFFFTVFFFLLLFI